MTPRLAVTQEQAEQLYVVDRGQASRTWRLRSGPVTLRLPGRPTMPCRIGDHAGLCGQVVPIPEGTRVEVGWWEPVDLADPLTRVDVRPPWHPVAVATLAEAAGLTDTFHHGQLVAVRGSDYWHVTLTDIEHPDA